MTGGWFTLWREVNTGTMVGVQSFIYCSIAPHSPQRKKINTEKKNSFTPNMYLY